MRHPLDGVNAKIGRAKKHLADLEADIGRRGQAHEYGIRVHIDPKTGEHVVYAFVPYELRMRWGILVGDVVHNLRSALDHLVYQLVVTNGKTPTNQTAFPIYPSLTEYRNKNGVRKIRGVRKNTITIIEGLQSKTADDPLLTLAALDDDDKHNLVNVAVLVADLRDVGIGGTGYIRQIHITTTRAALDGIEDGAELYRQLTDPGVYVETRPEVKVTFTESGPGRGNEVVPFLSRLIDHIENSVIPLFGLAKRKPAIPKWRPPT